MSINFFDCIYTTNHKFANFCENFLYLDGISNKLGYQRYMTQSQKDSSTAITKDRSTYSGWKNTVITVIKILFYFIFPWLVGVALIVKATHRKLSVYHLSDENIEAVNHLKSTILIPKPMSNTEVLLSNNEKKESIPLIEEDISKMQIPPNLDIRGNAWLEVFHLYNYSKFYLEQKHPEFYGDLTRCSYTIKEPNPSKNLSVIDNDFLSFHFEAEKCTCHPKCSEKTILAIPVLVNGNHWTLALIDRKKRTLEYYDSKLNYGDHKALIEHFTKFVDTLTKVDPHEKPYKFIFKIEKKLQPDTYHCGIWVLYFLEERLKNPEVDFNQLDVEKAQLMIADHRLKVQKVLWDLNQ